MLSQSNYQRDSDEKAGNYNCKRDWLTSHEWTPQVRHQEQLNEPEVPLKRHICRLVSDVVKAQAGVQMGDLVKHMKLLHKMKCLDWSS